MYPFWFYLTVMLTPTALFCSPLLGSSVRKQRHLIKECSHVKCRQPLSRTMADITRPEKFKLYAILSNKKGAFVASCLLRWLLQLYSNKKFREEVIAHFLFTVIWVSDMICRKKTFLCMHTAVIKQYRECSIGVSDGKHLWCMQLRWPHMAWHMLVHTKFHDHLVRNSNDIKVSTSTWHATEESDFLLCSDDHWWHDIHANLMIIGSDIHVILMVLPQKFKRL
jgi:hypothetical protein